MNNIKCTIDNVQCMDMLADKTIAIVGLGLMGGSLALALKKYAPTVKVMGINRSRPTIDKALEQGVIDEGYTQPGEALSKADIIVICLYPDATIEFVRQNLSFIKQGAIITDMCGIKDRICTEITELLKDRASFVGAHPMAGREKGGFGSATSELYKGCSYILTPNEYTDNNALDIIRAMAVIIGSREVVLTTAKKHDDMIAYTSQLPHIIAAAYVKSPAYTKCSGFTAGSFRDVSRVAGLNEDMWSQLFLANRMPLMEELGELIGNLQQIQTALECGGYDKLAALLKQSRQIKESAVHIHPPYITTK